MTYTSMHLDKDELKDEVCAALTTIDKVVDNVAKVIDDNIEEFIKRHIESVTITVNCEGVEVWYLDRNEDFFSVNPAPSLSQSIPLEVLLQKLDPAECDDREQQEKIATWLQAASQRFLKDDYFTK